MTVFVALVAYLVLPRSLAQSFFLTEKEREHAINRHNASFRTKYLHQNLVFDNIVTSLAALQKKNSHGPKSAAVC
jgi:hypothetical protein